MSEVDEQQKASVVGMGSVGGALIAGGVASQTKTGQKTIQSVKSGLGKVAATPVGKSISQSISKFAATSSGKAASQLASSGAKTLSKFGGVGVAAVASSVTGGMSIAETTKSKYMTEGEKAVSITGDLVGIGANIATVFVAGPIGILIALVAILGSLLDTFVNPFKNYFNKDLREMRDAYYDSAQKSFIDLGYNWPLEIKPDLMSPLLEDEEALKEYEGYLSEYYKENGLITDEEFLQEHQILMDLRNLRRYRKRFILNEQGDPISVRNLSLQTISSLEEEQRTIDEAEEDSQRSLLLIFAIMAKAKKIKQQKKSVLYQYIEINYISVIFSSISLIIIIFLSIYSILF